MKQEFVFVRCGDKKTAQDLKATAPPSLVFYYPDGTEMFRQGVRDAAGVEAAMKRALATYSDKPIAWLDYSEEAFAEAKSQEKLVVLAFADGREDSTKVLKTLEDRAIARVHEKLSFVKVNFSRDGRLEKQWKIYGAPTVLLVDPRKPLGPDGVIAKIYGKKGWRTYLKDIEKGLRLFKK